ncbi:MAG: hypothetical protein ACRDZ0_14545 [Acidimicrobiales bacterium]
MGPLDRPPHARSIARHWGELADDTTGARGNGLAPELPDAWSTELTQDDRGRYYADPSTPPPTEETDP